MASFATPNMNSVHNLSISPLPSLALDTTHVENKTPVLPRHVLYFEPKELCDLLLCVDNCHFYVHTQILARSSQYFRKTALNNTGRKKVEIEQIGVSGFDNVPVEYLECFLHLLYSTDIAKLLNLAITRGLAFVCGGSSVCTSVKEDTNNPKNRDTEPNNQLRGAGRPGDRTPVSDSSSVTISYFMMLSHYFDVPSVKSLGAKWILTNVADQHHLEDVLDWLVFTQALNLIDCQQHCITLIARNLDKTRIIATFPQWNQLNKVVLKDLIIAIHKHQLRVLANLQKKAGWL